MRPRVDITIKGRRLRIGRHYPVVPDSYVIDCTASHTAEKCSYVWSFGVVWATSTPRPPRRRTSEGLAQMTYISQG